MSTDKKQQHAHERNATKDFFLELLKVVVLSLAIIVPVRVFLVQPFIVKGSSMEPNFHNSEYLVINKLVYRLGDPARGDVIVFRLPQYRDYFIKRVIGLPGERVALISGAITIYNDAYPEGFRVSETEYLDPSVLTSGKVDVTLGDDEYFVLGDNRGNSSDSRYFGKVNRDALSGRAWVRLFPFTKIDVL